MDNNGLGRSPYFMRSTRIAASTRIPRLVVQSAPAPVPQTPPPKSSSTAIPQAPQSNRTRRAGPSPQIEPMRIQPTGHNSELDLTTWNPPPSPTSDTRRGQLAKTVDFKRSEPLAHDAPYPWGEVTNIMEVAWRRNRPGPVPREGANTGTKPPTKAALDLNKRDQMDSVILVPTLVQAYAPDVAELLLNTPLDLRARTEENSEDHDLVSIIKFCLSGPTLGDELQSEKDVEIWFHGSVLAPAIAVLQFLKKRDEGLFTPSYDALHVSSAKSYSAVVPDALFAILKRGEKAIQIGKILIAMEMKTSVLFGDDGFGVFDDLYKCGTRLGNAIKFNWPRAEELEEEGSDSEEASIVGEEDEIKSAFEKMGGSKASEVLVQTWLEMKKTGCLFGIITSKRATIFVKRLAGKLMVVSTMYFDETAPLLFYVIAFMLKALDAQLPAGGAKGTHTQGPRPRRSLPEPKIPAVDTAKRWWTAKQMETSEKEWSQVGLVEATMLEPTKASLARATL